MSDFYNDLWGIYIAIVVLLSLLGLVYLLYSQSKLKLPRGQKAEVTGHIWDEDLQEYNNPLPRWWSWLFYLTIFFGFIYLFLYPGLGYFTGQQQWTSSKQYEQESAALDAKIKPLYDAFLKQDVYALANDAQAMQAAQNLFVTYCAQCHSTDARGAKGFPHLRQKADPRDWLYGGTPEKIKETIAQGRNGEMPPFGATLGEEKVKDVANYVRKLTKRSHDTIRADRGESTFKQVCAVCHGPEGYGNQQIGAPNLHHKHWLYGSSEKNIIETITNGRKNYMPSWKNFLDESKIHVLTAYLLSLPDNDTTTPQTP